MYLPGNDYVSNQSKERVKDPTSISHHQPACPRNEPIHRIIRACYHPLNVRKDTAVSESSRCRLANFQLLHSPLFNCPIAAMLRSGSSRSLTRALVRNPPTSNVANAPCKLRNAPPSRVLSFKASTARPLVPYRPASLALVRHAHGHGGGALSAEAQKHQDRLKNEFLKATPQAVSTDSSVRTAVETGATEEDDVDMGAGIRSDIVRAELCVGGSQVKSIC